MLYPSVGFRPPSEEYRDNFDRIFRKAKEERAARAKERNTPYEEMLGALVESIEAGGRRG